MSPQGDEMIVFNISLNISEKFLFYPDDPSQKSQAINLEDRLHDNQFR